MQLEKDPRLDSVTVADLKEQFDLALKVRDDVTAANEMVIDDPRVQDGRWTTA